MYKSPSSKSPVVWKNPRWLVVAFGILLLSVLSVRSADLLLWQKKENRVNADIQSTDLLRVLERVSSVTGWEIYVEPDIRQTVSVKFKDLPAGEALHRFLGDLNFALLPQTNAAAKLFIYRTSVQEATQLVHRKDDSKAQSKKIANELVVTLKPGSKESIEELAKRLGAKVVGKIDGLHSYRLQFSDENAAQAAREALASDSSVDVDSNYMVDRPGQIDPLQMSSPPPFPLKPKVSTDASKIIVGLIDTPIQALGQGMDGFLMPSVHVAGDPGDQSGQITHGTSMAETLLRGLASGTQESGGSSVRILPVDVYGPNEQANTFDVAKGIYDAINSGATIINMSMGGDGDSKLLEDLIEDSHKQGVLFFGAAGNQPSTSPTYPAAYPDVVAVTAGDRKGNLASYANRGSFVDVIAPGMSVVSLDGQSYMVTGTSASTAYVSGTAAAYRATGKSATDAETIIRQNMAVKLPASSAPTGSP